MANNSIMAIEANNETKGGIFAEVINRVKAWLKKIHADRNARQEQERRKDINNSFRFEERDGRLFITCHGVAIRQISEGTEIRTAMAYLNASREAAANYETIILK